MANLPPSDTKRWVVSRKATVVAAVVNSGGVMAAEVSRIKHRPSCSLT